MTRTDGAAVPDDHVIVLFGALGDLSRRKLLPGLFHLERAGLMPENYRVIGTSRRGGTETNFRKAAREAIGKGAEGEDGERFPQPLSLRASSAEEPEPLAKALDQ